MRKTMMAMVPCYLLTKILEKDSRKTDAAGDELFVDAADRDSLAALIAPGKQDIDYSCSSVVGALETASVLVLELYSVDVLVVFDFRTHNTVDGAADSLAVHNKLLRDYLPQVHSCNTD